LAARRSHRESNWLAPAPRLAAAPRSRALRHETGSETCVLLPGSAPHSPATQPDRRLHADAPDRPHNRHPRHAAQSSSPHIRLRYSRVGAASVGCCACCCLAHPRTEPTVSTRPRRPTPSGVLRSARDRYRLAAAAARPRIGLFSASCPIVGLAFTCLVSAAFRFIVN